MNLSQSCIYLLEHMLHLVFFQYNIFCSGDPLECENLMTQMAVLFICWWRRHHKPTFSFLNDMEYQSVTARLLSKNLEYFSLITEKKVEIFHSILQKHSMEHDDGSSLSQIAKVIASFCFLSTFKACVVPFCQRDVSDNNLRL